MHPRGLPAAGAVLVFALLSAVALTPAFAGIYREPEPRGAPGTMVWPLTEADLNTYCRATPQTPGTALNPEAHVNVPGYDTCIYPGTFQILHSGVSNKAFLTAACLYLHPPRPGFKTETGPEMSLRTQTVCVMKPLHYAPFTVDYPARLYGQPHPGHTLRCQAPEWWAETRPKGTGAGGHYQWLRDGHSIHGATGVFPREDYRHDLIYTYYRVKGSDLRHRISCTVTDTDGNGRTGRSTSRALLITAKSGS